MAAVECEINDKATAITGNRTRRLSDVLRHDLELTATKVGCNAGDCGSCTVLIDGKTGCSCLTAIGQLDGSKIETLEGLRDDPTIKRLQQSFLHFGAAQCGICTPGMLISAKALLDVNHQPSRLQVEDALGGVLCRCTGYRKIVDAVVHAFDRMPEMETPGAGASIGTSIQHLDGKPKVTGTLAYGSDTVPANALHARVIRSPHHFAHFEIGDKAAFLTNNPDLIAVFDASDIKGCNCHGVIPPFADQPVFADKTVRHRGEAIACIVGERSAVQAFDPESFPVEWTSLPHALTPKKSADSSFPDIHQTRKQNLLIEGLVEKGDVLSALPSSIHQVTVQTSTPFIEHGYIEPEAGYCVRKGDRLELFGCTQAAQMDRDALAAILDLSREAIRIMPSACGGGFGAKLDISFQPYIALAAWALNRPVCITYTRSESMMSTTKRHPSDITLTLGCNEEGHLTGFDFEGVFNTGAYASWGPTVANRVPVHASGPYFVPHYRAKSRAVHTNAPSAGAFRGFGVPQAAIAQELAFDRLADKAGIDRLAFRQLNALQNGQPTATGQVFEKGVGISDCLQALKPRWDTARQSAAAFNEKTENAFIRKGIGLASCWYGCGNTSLPNPSTIRMGIKQCGQVVLHQGAMDIGQGANTVITQIAADALGVPVHAIALVDCDTDLTPDCGKTSASRQTYVTGKAAHLSADALRAQILRLANVSNEAVIEISNGKIVVGDGTNAISISLSDLMQNEFGYVLMAQETYDPPTSPLDEKGQGVPYAVYGYGAQMIELTVDMKLGTIKLDRIVTAHDVGRAINPLLIEGQIEGGVAQGIGLALMENYLPGQTENLHDYLMPTFGDMPEFENIIIEVEDAEGPYGAKGLGEHVLIPTAAAIVNAIKDASGACVADLPATPDKVLAAIRQAEGKQVL